MNLLNNINVGKKIILLVIVLLLCITSVAVLGISRLQNVNSESEALYQNNLLALSSIKEANIQLINQQRAVRNAILIPENFDAYYADYEEAEKILQQEMDIVGKRLVTAAALKDYQELHQAYLALAPLQKNIFELIKTSALERLVKEIVDMRPTVNILDENMTKLSEVIELAAENRSKQVAKATQQGLVLSLSVLGCALFLGGLLGFFIRRSIANPLMDITEKAALVAGGNLDQEFRLNQRDELGSLSQALEQMVVNLRSRIAEAEQKSQEAEEQSQKAQEAMLEANAAKENAEAGQRAILDAAEQVEIVNSHRTTFCPG